MQQRDYQIISAVPLWMQNLVFFCAVVTISMGLISWYSGSYIAQQRAEIAVHSRMLPSPEALQHNPYRDLSLSAKAAVVYDVTRNTIVYGMNQDMQFPLASLTKLMTALVALETMPSYTAVSIVPLQPEGDINLRPGERWKFSDLLSYTLMTSSNTGADSIAAAAAAVMMGEGTNAPSGASPIAFVSAMNRRAAALGLAQTYFLNDSGLDTGKTVSGAYGSARDVARLLSYLLAHYPAALGATTDVQKDFSAPDGRTIAAVNTNSSVASIPGIVGSKTGLTDLAGGNLAVAFDASFGEPFVVVVLGSTDTDRFTDTKTLVQATISYLGAPLQSPAAAAMNMTPLP